MRNNPTKNRNVLGIDPGFADIGCVLVSADGSRLLRALHIKTSKSTRKIPVSVDNENRARDIYSSLLPLYEECAIVCVEAESYPRNASSAAKVAMCRGVVIALAQQFDVSIVQVSPKDLKLRVVGRKSASKKEVEDALRVRMGSQVEIIDNNYPKSKRSHIYDALGAVIACLSTNEMRLLRNL